jgi:hypothetical protein
VGGGAELVWAGERFLVDAGVEPFQDLQLWLAPSVDPSYAGFLAVDGSKAFAAGLQHRLVEETARDTLAWIGSGAPTYVDQGRPKPGLDRGREVELLAEALV